MLGVWIKFHHQRLKMKKIYLGAVQLRVAEFAVDVVIRTVTGEHGVQRSGAPGTVEALPMPHLSLGQLQLCGEHSTTTSRTSLAIRSHDGSRIRSHKWSLGSQVIFTVRFNFNLILLVSKLKTSLRINGIF